jgi:hypothetical protein
VHVGNTCNRRIAAVLLSTLWLLAAAGALIIDCRGNAIPFTGSLEIVIDSPVDGKVYPVNDVRLKFRVLLPQSSYMRLDAAVDYFVNDRHYLGNENVDTILKDLPNGVYVLSVYAETGVWGPIFRSAGVTFTVNTGEAPEVSVICAQAYTTSSVSLGILTDVADSTVSYSLDGVDSVVLPAGSAVPFEGRYLYNFTVSGLADGGHTVTAFVVDAVGNTGVSDAAFMVETAGTEQPGESQPVTFPTTLVGVALIVSVAIVFGLVAYFLRRKKRRRAA